MATRDRVGILWLMWKLNIEVFVPLRKGELKGVLI
jgi:hypothetical protein